MENKLVLVQYREFGAEDDEARWITADIYVQWPESGLNQYSFVGTLEFPLRYLSEMKQNINANWELLATSKS
jgi:hypothetical protein